MKPTSLRLTRYSVALPLLVLGFYAAVFVRSFDLMLDPLTWAAFCGCDIPGQIEEIKRAGWAYRGVDVRAMVANGPTTSWQVAIALIFPGSLLATGYLTHPGPVWFKYAEFVAPVLVGLPFWMLLGLWLDTIGAKRLPRLIRSSRTGRAAVFLLSVPAAILIVWPAPPLHSDGSTILQLFTLLFWIVAFLAILGERTFWLLRLLQTPHSNPLR